MPMDKYPLVANYRCNPDCIIAKMNLIKSSVRGLCSDARPWLRARCQRVLPKTPEEDLAVPRPATQTSCQVRGASVCVVWVKEGKSQKGGVSSFLLDGWQERGKKKSRGDVGVEDVMSSHGLTTPSLVADRPAPPPQCVFNSLCLLVPPRSVLVPLCVHATSLALILQECDSLWIVWKYPGRFPHVNANEPSSWRHFPLSFALVTAYIEGLLSSLFCAK